MSLANAQRNGYAEATFNAKDFVNAEVPVVEPR